MSNLYIKGIIRPAQINELVSNNGLGSVLPYQQVFCKSMITGEFCGPYFMSSFKNYEEIYIALDSQQLYIYDHVYTDLDAKEFQMKLRPATFSDTLLDDIEIRFGWTFFYKDYKNKMHGPFYTDEHILYDGLKKQIEFSSIYIIAESQKFEQLQDFL